jgi:hypothetical protein
MSSLENIIAHILHEERGGGYGSCKVFWHNARIPCKSQQTVKNGVPLWALWVLHHPDRYGLSGGHPNTFQISPACSQGCGGCIPRKDWLCGVLLLLRSNNTPHSQRSGLHCRRMGIVCSRSAISYLKGIGDYSTRLVGGTCGCVREPGSRTLSILVGCLVF